MRSVSFFCTCSLSTGTCVVHAFASDFVDVCVYVFANVLVFVKVCLCVSLLSIDT